MAVVNLVYQRLTRLTVKVDFSEAKTNLADNRLLMYNLVDYRLDWWILWWIIE